MTDPVRLLRRAWGLFRTESRLDTGLALLFLVAALAPFAYTYWQMRASSGGRGGTTDGEGIPGV